MNDLLLGRFKRDSMVTNSDSSDATQAENLGKRLRYVQIQIQFTAETDDEALAVKKAVSEALLLFDRVGVTFAMTERPGGVPPSMRR